MRRHAGVLAGGRLHVAVDEPRRAHEPTMGRPLTWPADPTALPFLDAQGNLVLPLNAPTRFRWWAGGQSVAQTLADLRQAAAA